MQSTAYIPKKTIYLIRHGQTDFNKQGIVQGSGINSSLNEEGKHQAEKFFHRFKEVPFEKIYVTELIRTHQTVAPFQSLNIPIEIIPEFNEINWGILEGVKPTPEHQIEFSAMLANWRNGELDKCVSGGETPLELYSRQQKGLEKILNNPENLVLLCMHGRAMRSFLCLLTQTPLRLMDTFDHDNLCLYVLEQEENASTFKITLHNHQDHLQTTNE
jgi:probable phosphoglycerate mutase